MKLAGTAILAAIVVAGAIAQTVVQSESHKDLWQPSRTLKDQDITVTPWGSGSIAQTDEAANDGAYSLRVSTHNYFQGGLLKLHAPVDVSQNYDDPSSMLALTIRSADSTVLGGQNPRTGPGGYPGYPGGPGGPGGRIGAGGGRGVGIPGAAGGPVGGGAFPGQPGGRLTPGGGAQVGGRIGGGVPGQVPGFPGGPGGPGGRFPGGGPQGGPGRLGGPGGRPGDPNSQKPPPKLSTIRVIISTTDGKKSEAYLPLPNASSKNPWIEVAIPLQKIAGFDNTNKIIDQVGFSGDATATYYIGDLRLEHDPTPITGEMNAIEPLNLALGDTVKLVGDGYGGATILKYVWCFDSANGFTEDAEGQGVLHKFRKAGKFIVTLQIQDYFGLKPPFSTTVAVTVNP